MMAVAFGATIVLMMTHSPKNVVWDVVAFLPVPIFFLSYSPLRSVVLGPCREWFGSFVQNFLIVVAILVVIFLLVLFFLLFGAFDGLRWTFRKVCELICKPVHWISGKKSEPKSDTQSPQPTTQVWKKKQNLASELFSEHFFYFQVVTEHVCVLIISILRM